MNGVLFLSTPNERIRYAREKAGFTQRGFADLVNLSQANWSKIERGKTRITIDLLEKVNSILKLDINYYFGTVNYKEAHVTD